MLKIWIVLPLFVQGFLMFFDEFFFHHKRGLPKWEVLGHPVDTLSVLFPFALTIFLKPSPWTELIFIGFSILSCLCVIKDEWIHKDLCTYEEMALHGLLFTIHPMVFLSTYYLWHANTLNLIFFELSTHQFLITQLFIILCFGSYQIIYWSVYRGYFNKQ